MLVDAPESRRALAGPLAKMVTAMRAPMAIAGKAAQRNVTDPLARGSWHMLEFTRLPP
jgi:hypothetical protein